MTDRLVSTPAVVRFGNIELDVRAGALRRNGQRVTLPDQPLHLLTALLERPGELVTRDELRRRLWPADTYVDFEHGLNAAVKRLRDALGDSAETPQYIETVPRRGYRFVAPVENPAAGRPATDSIARQHQDDVVPTAVGVAAPGRRRGMTILLAAIAVAAIGAVGWWVARQSSASRDAAVRPPAAIARPLTRLTFGAGLQTDVTWSPDGQRIAYASDKAGNFDIWVQPVAGGEPAQLTISPDADTQPAWAPDGSSIAFRSERDGGGVFVVPALGGAARRLTTFGAHPAWMADGRDIFVRTGLEGAVARAYLVSARGDEPAREILSEFLRGGLWDWMAPHPDGRLSVIGSHRTRGPGFYTLSGDGGNLTVVKPPTSLPASLSEGEHHPEQRFQWSPQGNALYLEVAANQIRSLWRIPVAPATLQWLSAERLTTGADNAVSPAISADGTRIAFASQQMTSRAWIYPFDAATGRLEGDGRPVTDEDTTIIWPGLSRDGRSLLYSAQRTGTDRVDAIKTNLETGATSLLARNARGPLESPDGTRHAYLLSRRAMGARDASAETNAFEFALALRDRTGSERLLSRWSGRAKIFPSDWTRDGDAVLCSYFLESIGSGPGALALWPVGREIPEKPDRVLLHVPGSVLWQATYSPDWRWISFVAAPIDRPGTLELGIIPASGASADSWTRIAADHEWPDKPRWAPDGRTLYSSHESREVTSTSGVCGWIRCGPPLSASRSRSRPSIHPVF